MKRRIVIAALLSGAIAALSAQGEAPLKLGSLIIFLLAGLLLLLAGASVGLLFMYHRSRQALLELRRLDEKEKSILANLAEGEAKYRRIVDTASEGIWVLGPEATTTFVNARMAEMLGYAAEEIAGRPVTDFMFKEDLPDHHGRMENRRTGISEQYERRFRRKNGQTVWALVSATPVFDDEHNFQGSFGMFNDITERKRIEDTLFFVAQRGWLAGAENFFDALAQFIGENIDMDYVIIDRIDENPHIAETVALYAKGEIAPNMRYALKGTPCENVMGKRLCVYPRGVQQLFPDDTLLVEMGAESYIGIPLWESSGRPIGLIALMDGKPLHDHEPITRLLQLVAIRAAAELERGQSDRMLRKREHEFRTLAEGMPDNIVRYDREGRAVYVNPVFEKTLGIAAADMVGTRVREFFTDGRYEAYAQAVDAALAGGENGEIEIIVPLPGEEQVIHQIRMIVERDEQGEVTGVLAIGRDITELKNAEQERQSNLKFLESMDVINRALQSTNNLEQMTSDVLDTVLSIFGCDRAFLMYPCDPESRTWTAPMERSKLGYPGVLALGLQIPMDQDVAETLRILLASDGPVMFGPGTGHPLPADVSEKFGFKCFMSMAIHPRVGAAWQFGIHQCSHARVWMPEETRLFQEIGRRLADGLGTLLTYRNLQDSEQRFRLVFENSPVSIGEEDYSGVKTHFDGLRKEGVADIETYFERHPEAVGHCAELVRFVDVNRAALALHAAANKEELLAGLTRTFTDETFETFRLSLVCLWNGGTEMTRDTVIRTLTGDLRHVTVYFSVCPGYEQTLSKILISMADITDRKRAEEEIHTLNKELEQRVKDRTAELEEKNRELEKMNRLFVGRELKMAELKEQIKALKSRPIGSNEE